MQRVYLKTYDAMLRKKVKYSKFINGLIFLPQKTASDITSMINK